MASYVYRCAQCGDTERTAPIGTAARETPCQSCGGVMRLVLGVGTYIAASATPNKRARVREIEQTEREWSADMPAYKRMRRRGLQPEHIDGCARLENEVGDQVDLNHRDLITQFGRERVTEGMDQVAVLKAEAS